MPPKKLLTPATPAAPNSSDRYCPHLWLFAVNEGEEDGMLVYSGEHVGAGGSQFLVMAYGSPGDFEILSWTLLDTSKIELYDKIKDHWHVFANGFHWITYSVDSDDQLWLLKVQRSGAGVSLTFDILLNLQLAYVPSGTLPINPYAFELTSNHFTNDHFLVATRDGLRVGIWKSEEHLTKGPGHTILHVSYRIDGAASAGGLGYGSPLYDVIGSRFKVTPFGTQSDSSSDLTHGTEASSITPEAAAGADVSAGSSLLSGEVFVLASDKSLGIDLGSKIFSTPTHVRLYITDSEISELSHTTRLEATPDLGSYVLFDPDYIAQRFATLVSLDGIYDGYNIITSIVTHIPRPTSGYSPFTDDYGDLVHALYDADWHERGFDLLGPDNTKPGIDWLGSNLSARAHTMRYSVQGTNYLVTCWDIRDTSTGGAECRLARQEIL